jgi:hypothetical protein
MEEAIAIYKFSKGIRRGKQRYVILSILLPAILIAFLFLSPTTRDESLASKAGIGLFSFVILGLIFYFTASKTIRKLSELSVHLFPDRLERQGGKQKEVYLWKDVLHAETLEYPNGEITLMKLTFANKKVLTLFGFEDMETATKEIAQYIPDKDLIFHKKAKINWDNPIILTLSSVLILAIILAVQEIGEVAYRFFNVLFFSAFGLYNLIARPISRAQGKGWERFETVIGIFLIVCSVLLLALELFLK